MSKYEAEFLAQKKEVEELIEKTTDPRHRKILKNYRRHSILEISGRSDDILSPGMTVEHPVYKVIEGGKTIVFDGMEAVRGFYNALESTDSLVMWTSNSKIAVADWGFAGEVQFNQFVKGSVLQQEGVFAGIADSAHGNTGTPEEGSDELDPEATYLVRRPIAYVWPYSEDGRLLGEQVYEDQSWRSVEKVEPEDVITPERARELLAPQLDSYWP